jgi:hypothetical protein
MRLKSATWKPVEEEYFAMNWDVDIFPILNKDIVLKRFRWEETHLTNSMSILRAWCEMTLNGLMHLCKPFFGRFQYQQPKVIPMLSDVWSRAFRNAKDRLFEQMMTNGEDRPDSSFRPADLAKAVKRSWRGLLSEVYIRALFRGYWGNCHSIRGIFSTYELLAWLNHLAIFKRNYCPNGVLFLESTKVFRSLYRNPRR